MSRTFPRLFAVVLVLALLVGTVGLASQPAWAGHGNDDEHGHGNKHVSSTFGDTTLEDYPWAFKHIEKMAAKGFIKGVGNGVFNGNADIKHEEAVIMIVRYMGLEDEAQAAMNATLPFSDAKSIDSWARGYVRVALDDNLLWMPDSSQLTRFEPNTPTTRVEAVVMLVKAAGLEAEAKTRMHQTLTFKDAATIPAAYVGYVAVGVEQGLVKGYDDNTFQPFKPVKRAEMATFLGRTDDAFPRHGDDNEVNGELVSTTATSITIESKDQRGTFALAANCPVYLDDQPATLADLQAGDQVELELDSQNRVVFIDAQRGDDTTPIPLTLTGTVRSVTIGIGVPSTMVVRLASNAGDKTFIIAGNCVIKVDGVAVTVADIEVGDNVTLKLISGTSDQLAEILITRDQITSVAGIVKGLTLGTNASITIRPDHQTKDVTYSLAANGIVKLNGLVSSYAQTGIAIGDRVELKLAAGKVTEINVIRTQITSVAGIVKGLTLGTNASITVRPDTQTTNVTYSLATNVIVKVNGSVSSFGEAGIVVGDRVELKLSNSQVTEINVVRNQVTSVAGIVKGLTIGANPAITILPDSQHSNVTYTLASNCVVKVDGAVSSLAQAGIVIGDRVELKLSNSQVTEINVVRNQVTSVAGIVKGLTLGTNASITVRPDTQTTNVTYSLATNVVVKVNGVVSSFAQAGIVIGDRVELKLSNSQVTEINVVRNQVTSVAGIVKGLALGTTSNITILPDNMTANVTYSLASNCVVEVNGRASSFAEALIVIDDRVELKLTGAQVTEINVVRAQTSTVTGTVKNIAINTGTYSTITLLPTGQTTNVTYLMANNVVVKYNNTTVAVTDIKVGDNVTLTLTTQSGLPLVTQVVIASRETTAGGTVTGINYDARTLTVTKNGVATTYTVAATAVVTLLDQSFTWNQVALNDVVTLTILDSTVTKINITVHNTSYIGTVKSVTVDATGNHFTATISGVDRTVDVPATAAITHAGQPATFADITIGATVVITGAFDGTKVVAAQIAIQ